MSEFNNFNTCEYGLGEDQYYRPVMDCRRAVIERYDEYITNIETNDFDNLSADDFTDSPSIKRLPGLYSSETNQILTLQVSKDVQLFNQYLLPDELAISGLVPFDDTKKSMWLPADNSLRGRPKLYDVDLFMRDDLPQELRTRTYDRPIDRACFDADIRSELCIIMRDVCQRNFAGQIVNYYDIVQVPFTHPNLKVGAIFKRNETQSQTPLEILVNRSNLGMIQQVERLLNDNSGIYQTTSQLCEQYQHDLEQMICQLGERQLVVTAEMTRLVSRQVDIFVDAHVADLRPEIVQADGKYRVVYGASLIDPQSLAAEPVHIYPQSIKDAKWF